MFWKIIISDFQIGVILVWSKFLLDYKNIFQLP